MTPMTPLTPLGVQDDVIFNQPRRENFCRSVSLKLFWEQDDLVKWYYLFSLKLTFHFSKKIYYIYNEKRSEILQLV